jgi:hypothetical protein
VLDDDVVVVEFPPSDGVVATSIVVAIVSLGVVVATVSLVVVVAIVHVTDVVCSVVDIVVVGGGVVGTILLWEQFDVSTESLLLILINTCNGGIEVKYP